jgi:hypothetical protein
MSLIEYDPSRSALYTPQARPTLFVAGGQYSTVQLGIECARLAYLRAADEPDAADDPKRLADALTAVGFGKPQPIRGAVGTQLFGAYRQRDKLALIAFRGTQPDELADLATDLEASTMPWPAGGRVHRGFGTAIQSVTDQVDAWLSGLPARNGLLLCGHSLGAALATLAASFWKATDVVTIGSPRVGDAAFVTTIEQVPMTRIVDCCDAVATVPPDTPWYTHVGRPTFIDHEGHVVFDPDGARVVADQAEARALYPFDHKWKVDAVLLRDLADHAPINYARAFFPGP